MESYLHYLGGLLKSSASSGFQDAVQRLANENVPKVISLVEQKVAAKKATTTKKEK